MDTASSKIDLNYSFLLQVFGIKLDLMILLLSFGFYKQWIAEVLVMKMKRRFIVPIPISLYDLTVGEPSIFDQNINVRGAFSIGFTDKPFDCEPMVSLVGRRYERRKPA